MGKPLNDLTGFAFGSLTVLRLGEKERKTTGAWWLCQCACGKQKNIPASDLVSGGTNSCGCEHKARIAKAFTRHGMTGSRTYRIWQNMKTRCKKHMDYAGRGITYDKLWDKFDNFLADMGVAPDDMSLDRIDCNGNYEKSNCRWATQKQQMNNRRTNTFIEWDGKTQTISEWADELGISPTTLRCRIYEYGWSLERAMTEKVNESFRRKTDVLAGAELQDADGNVMTQEEADAFIATLP